VAPFLFGLGARRQPSLATVSLKALSGLHKERLHILAQNRGRHQQRSMVETGN
jgi:hypothetical protein